MSDEEKKIVEVTVHQEIAQRAAVDTRVDLVSVLAALGLSGAMLTDRKSDDPKLPVHIEKHLVRVAAHFYQQHYHRHSNGFVMMPREAFEQLHAKATKWDEREAQLS